MNTPALAPHGAPPLLAQMAVLADPVRVRLLALLDGRELAVAELCAVLQLPQSTVSRHLRTLADEGWLAARAEATSRLYQLAQPDLGASARQLWALVREQADVTPAAAEDARRLEDVLARRGSRQQSFFRSAAGQWDRLRRELFGTTFDLACLAGLLADDTKIGDLGCGTGHLSAVLAPFVGRVVAVDSSPEMLAAARERLDALGNVDLRQGTLEALPIETGELDAALLCLVLHYVADPGAVVREAVRTLAPGGRLVIVDMLPHERTDLHERMGHAWPGFGAAATHRWFANSPVSAPTIHELPADGAARGPRLFIATARRNRDDSARISPPTPGPHHRLLAPASGPTKVPSRSAQHRSGRNVNTSGASRRNPLPQGEKK